MSPAKILVIEDDPEAAYLLEAGLQKHFQVAVALNAHDGLQLFHRWKPDLLLLDLGLPDGNGFTLIQNIRLMSEVPIVVVSARGSTPDVIRALELGADDYVRKPYQMAELLARVHALLRRARPNTPPPRRFYDDGFLEIDLEARKVKVQGRPVDLSPTEFQLLALLLQYAGKTVPYQEILRQVWGPGYERSRNLIAVYIHYLREKLHSPHQGHEYLKADWGKGYRFNPRPQRRPRDAEGEV